jgi:hypothetical protein
MRRLIKILVVSICLTVPAYAEGPGAIDPDNSWPTIVARAWSDPVFKDKLLNDPHAALAEFGIKIPGGSELKVIEDTPDTRHLVLPLAPDNAGTLSAEELEKEYTDPWGVKQTN